MSYRRNRQTVRYKEFDFISMLSGRSIAWAETPEEVMVIANDYEPNPEVLVIGIDESGYQAQTWAINEVLNGTFERDLEVPDVPYPQGRNKIRPLKRGEEHDQGIQAEGGNFKQT